jgi:hypothetical protein
MTPENIKIKIAEACGWKRIYPGSKLGSMYGFKSGNHRVHSIPDYISDLNAMHEAKKTLTDEQRPIYWRTLYEVCKTTEWPFNAEAHQEAEAFLRTINKWEES